MYANGCCCLLQPILPPVLALVLISGSHTPAVECLQLCYQSHSQPQILHLPWEYYIPAQHDSHSIVTIASGSCRLASCPAPILALLNTNGCGSLAQPDLPPNSAYMQADGCGSPSWPSLPSLSAYMLTTGSSGLTREFLNFLYQAFPQPQFSCLPVGAVAQPDMAHPRFWHSLVGTTA